MLVSVVINTYNRVATLKQTLDALRVQSFADFEVIVVNGPSTDGTAALLASRASEIRVVDCPERRLSQSRNLGVDATAGEIVAFIDDDAIPEPDWLADLVAAYADPDVAGVGGVVLDESGVHAQYRFSACDRVARPDYDLAEPDPALSVPGADPFLYLQGTNMSFRRSALEAVGGFDEEIEYNYDEADLCLRLIDAGHRLVALDSARVHHKVAASHLRRAARVTLDPYFEIKNRAYFAVRHGRPAREKPEILAILERHAEHVRATAREQAEQGRITNAELAHLLARLSDGLEVGVARGLAAAPQGRAIEPRDPEAFRAYPVPRPADRRLRIAFVAFDYPPPRGGGIARFTQDLAVGLAAEGHEVHVLAHDEGPDRVELEAGVWIHRHPYGARFVPELDGLSIGEAAKRLSWVYRAVARLHARTPLDVVSAPQWAGDALLVAHDARWPTVVTCMTPMRIVAATQPAVAALPESALQIRLEDAAAATATRLHAISNAILTEARVAAPDVAADVVPLGTADRSMEFPRRRDDEDVVEILFVGRMEPRKGVDVLLEAAAELLRERPQARLTLVGADAATGGEAYSVRFARDAPDVAERVRFRGEVSEDELFQAYADCDVFCAPSRYDSFGLILTEAMSFARPVIAGRTGGMPEVVGDAGLLVEPGDVAELREALRSLVDDPALRAGLGAAGRARFEAEFEAGAAARRTAAVYAAVADEHTGRPGTVEAPVRDATVELLVELGELDAITAARAAERLLAPDAFPVDYEARIRQASALTDDAEFVTALYPLLLERAADQEGLAAALERFAEDGSRLTVLASIAVSDEARARGVPPTLVDRLRGVDPVATVAAVRAVWTRDDETFIDGLPAALNVVGPAEELRSAARAALPNGRRAALNALIARPELARELEPPARLALAHADLHTRAELETGLATAARRGAAAFVDAAYLLLLGRAAEPPARTQLVQRLEGGAAPAVIAREIASSDEARSRGLDPAWTEGLEQRVPALRASRGLSARVRRLTRGRRRAPAWRVAVEGQRRALNRWAERLIRDERVGRALLSERIAALEETVRLLQAEQETTRDQLRAEMVAHRVFGPHERLSIAETALVHDAMFNTVSGTITVGEHAFFGHDVAVLTGTHDVERFGADRQTAIPQSGRDVEIGPGAWVASRATVLGPCRIGADAVVAAGAVVTGDVPAGAVVAGIPARVVRRVATDHN